MDASNPKKAYTIDDIYALPEGQRGELIEKKRGAGLIRHLSYHFKSEYLTSPQLPS